jgi:hypothetical protein
MNSSESLETYARKLGVALFLIEQELSTRLFLKTLHAEGITHITLERNLDKLILESLGLDESNDETLKRYIKIMDKYATIPKALRTDSTNDSVLEQARQACLELTAEQKCISKTESWKS